MILAYILHPDTAGATVRTAAVLARHFGKSLGLLAFAAGDEPAVREEAVLARLAAAEAGVPAAVHVRRDPPAALGRVCEELEASLLVVQAVDARPRALQRLLHACRPLRIPYLFWMDTFAQFSPARVLVPVTFLEEEYEKAQFASAFGRFFHSRLLLLQANDYGSKAARTVGRISALLDKFSLDYRVEKGAGDSFKVEAEAVRRAAAEGYGLVLLSASREYGLDDLLFGPPERRLLRRTSVPLLLINPRGDLYALCD